MARKDQTQNCTLFVSFSHILPLKWIGELESTHYSGNGVNEQTLTKWTPPNPEEYLRDPTEAPGTITWSTIVRLLSDWVEGFKDSFREDGVVENRNQFKFGLFLAFQMISVLSLPAHLGNGRVVRRVNMLL